MVGVPGLDGETQAKVVRAVVVVVVLVGVVVVEGSGSQTRKQSSMMQGVVNIVNGRDRSWLVAANEAIPRQTWEEWRSARAVWRGMDWGSSSACHAAATGGLESESAEGADAGANAADAPCAGWLRNAMH